MTGASSQWSASRLAVGQRGARWSAFFAALIAVVGFGCGQNPDYPPPGNGGGSNQGHTTGVGSGTGAGTATGALTGACDPEGATRDCHLMLGQFGEVVACYNGTQDCYLGLWTPCRAGEYSMRTLSVHRPQTQALEPADSVVLDAEPAALPKPLNATEALCSDDPCDPTCRTFKEAGYTLGMGMSGSSLAWAGGTVSGVASAKGNLLSSGILNQPCSTGKDCQMNEYCSHPLTPTACEHDKCAAGVALTASCDSACVASVCAQNPDCCKYTGPCAHAPCFTGAALGCNDPMNGPIDPNVQAVCNNTPSCCDTMAGTWNAACVADYASQRGQPCPSSPATAWSSPGTYAGPASLSCTQLVHDVCGATCATPQGTCAHDMCTTGVALSKTPVSCDPSNCVSGVCALQPSCCDVANGAWDASCIALLPQACGRTCPASGVCAPIIQNQVDPTCNGPDLTAAPPCLDVGAQSPISACTAGGDAACGGTKSGLVCNVIKQCVAGCHAGGNGCPTGLTCSSSTSVIGTCNGCTMDSQCGGPTSGMICSGGSCIGGCKASGNQCPAGQLCNTITNTCVSKFKVPDPANPGMTVTTAGYYVPVCNFGKLATPAGAKTVLTIYASGTGGLPNPPPAGATVKGTCSTTQQILPGKCVDVPCDTSVGTQGAFAEIYVNPPTAPIAGYTPINECNTTNNWAVNIDNWQPGNNPVICDKPSCAVAGGLIRSTPVHMVIETEASGFSIFNIAQWIAVRAGVSSFLTNATAQTYSSTWAAVGAFPDNSGTPCACTTGCLNTPPGMTQLPVTSASMLNTSLPMSVTTSSSAPYVTALANALDYAANDPTAAGSPVPINETVVMILTNDPTNQGAPCSPSTNTNVVPAMSALAAQYYAQYGVRTFVIAVPNSGSSSMYAAAQQIAAAGGGRAYYAVNPSPNTVTSWLADIQDYSEAACSYTLPDPTLFDPSTTTVLYGTATTVPPQIALTIVQPTVAAVNAAKALGKTYLDTCLAQCGDASSGVDGYCYDDFPPPAGAPTRIVMCPKTCRTIAKDVYTTSGAAQHGLGQYSPGCPSSFITGLGPNLQPYQGQCIEPGTKPLWTFLAYDTQTPSDPSGTPNVTFDVRTANVDPITKMCPPVTNTAAYSASKNVATAKLYTNAGGWDSQVCSINQNASGCPVDLVSKLSNGTTPPLMVDGGTPSGPPVGVDGGAPINSGALADCLALSITLNTNANGTAPPVLNGFELRYSCPAAE